MDQRGLFDQDRAKKGRDAGRQKAASRAAELLTDCREACKRAARCRPDHTATADDAYRWLAENGKDEGALGNAAGSLFTEGEWVFTGQWRESERVSNHGRAIRVWRLR